MAKKKKAHQVLTQRNRNRLMKKIHVLLGQIDDVIAAGKKYSSESNEEVEFTPAMLTWRNGGELRHLFRAGTGSRAFHQGGKD